ncbi:siderophore-interacting protein [Luteimicrobium xylanilyticum]|uniref:Ferric-chelate reductase (NADPH) n=1 Tax=Luteimicrobium xylanilyticum TaxID=1133546 RepID=A0A5P9QAB6_9MICO|nr:siderophore-interacting protein [Luteimicrobium xylanilyticum]QFU98408.1 Ferric-chelate reductase (NADPH) [Luteimicrobium xylanilyticum]
MSGTGTMTEATTDRGPQPEASFNHFPTRIRQLTVLRRSHVTPRMVRVTLGGDELAGFESHLPDEHCKLVFPDPGSDVVRHPWQEEGEDHLEWPEPFPPTREYSVRRYDPVAREVDLDFVVHPGGLAADWAQGAEPGDRLWVAGPRPGIVVGPEFGLLVLLADETGLPALARWLEELPSDARGVAAIEIHDDAERQDLRVPDGFTVTWLSRDGAEPGTTTLLGDFAERIDLPDDVWTYVWAFAEAGCVKPVRRWARAHGIGRKQSDIGGYWKRGRTNSYQAVVADREHAEEMRDRVVVPISDHDHGDHDHHDHDHHED